MEQALKVNSKMPADLFVRGVQLAKDPAEAFRVVKEWKREQVAESVCFAETVGVHGPGYERYLGSSDFVYCFKDSDALQTHKSSTGLAQHNLLSGRSFYRPIWLCQAIAFWNGSTLSAAEEVQKKFSPHLSVAFNAAGDRYTYLYNSTPETSILEFDFGVHNSGVDIYKRIRPLA